MYNVSGISFNGGAETTGSAARKVRQYYNECPPENNECDTVNFKGKEYPYYNAEDKTGSPVLKLTLWLLGAAGAVGGLGYLHKTGTISKLKAGAFKDKFAEPVTNKCHEWCTVAKTKGTDLLNKLKNLGKKG